MVNKGQKWALYHCLQRDKTPSRIIFKASTIKFPWLLRFAIIYPKIAYQKSSTLFFVTEETTTNILNVIKWNYSWGKPRKLQFATEHSKLAATKGGKMGTAGISRECYGTNSWSCPFILSLGFFSWCFGNFEWTDRNPT